MKKIIFGYTSMIITLALAILIPEFFRMNDYSKAVAGTIGAFNLVVSGIIIIKGHLDLGNFPEV